MTAPTGAQSYRKVARLDLIGEIRADEKAVLSFQRGVTEYPNIGDAAIMLTEGELRLVYGAADANHAHIGDLQQNPKSASTSTSTISSAGISPSSARPASASRAALPSSCKKILDSRPNLRIFLIDPHNEYGHCFGDKAQVLTPRNLRLPFWLFNFEEIVDALFGGRPGVDEEVEILSEVIPLAKGAYLQYRAGGADRVITKKRDPRDCRLHRRYAGALPHRGSGRPARRAHGQARKPLLAHDLSQADLAHSDLPQSSALQLHVRERQYRRRHHGRDSQSAVPAAAAGQADDGDGSCRLPGGSGRTRWCRYSAAWLSTSACGATA